MTVKKSDLRADPYEALANAIVMQAADDYTHALKVLKKHPNADKARAQKSTIEHFFRSGWFSILTKVEPEYLIEGLHAKVDAMP